MVDGQDGTSLQSTLDTLVPQWIADAWPLATGPHRHDRSLATPSPIGLPAGVTLLAACAVNLSIMVLGPPTVAETGRPGDKGQSPVVPARGTRSVRK